MISKYTNSKYAFFNRCVFLFLTLVFIQVQSLKAEPVVKSKVQTLDLNFKPATASLEDGVLKMNSANIFQLGLNNLASIDQSTLKGSNNYASIEQSEKSTDSLAQIIQAGNSNQAVITQNGISTTAYIYQLGLSNRAFINQH